MTAAVLPGPALRGRDATVPVAIGSDRIALTAARPLFAPGSVRHMLLLSVIVLFPFQVLGLDVGTTKFDLANIAFVLFVLSCLVGSAQFSDRFKIFIAAYLVAEAIMFFVGPTTVGRFASAFIWLTSVILLFGRRDHVPMNAGRAYWLTLASTGAVAVSILYQFLFEGLERPAGFMAEPSPAGLVLLAAVAGLVISSRWAPTQAAKLLSLLAALFFFGLSILTKTTHIISFAAGLVTIGVASRSFSLRTVIPAVLLLGVVYWFISFDEHYQSRLDVAGAASNLSLLSWLQGFDQMTASLRHYPLIGAGLGATGQFDFYSAYTLNLFLAGLADLNRQDAFSGLFRLTIELGPVMMGVVLFVIGRRLHQLWRAVGDDLLPTGSEAQAQMFLFTFAFTLVFGILLKEPTYSRSHFVVAALLFSLVPLRAVVHVPAALAIRLRAGLR